MLMEAVCTSNLAAVVNLCGGGAEDPNETGIEVDNDLSPLQWVCDNPDTPLAADMVRVMLQHGGNLDLVMDNGGRGTRVAQCCGTCMNRTKRAPVEFWRSFRNMTRPKAGPCGWRA